MDEDEEIRRFLKEGPEPDEDAQIRGFLKGSEAPIPPPVLEVRGPNLGDLDGPSKASVGPPGSPRTPDLERGGDTPPDKEIVAPGASQRPSVAPQRGIAGMETGARKAREENLKKALVPPVGVPGRFQGQPAPEHQRAHEHFKRLNADPEAKEFYLSTGRNPYAGPREQFVSGGEGDFVSALGVPGREAQALVLAASDAIFGRDERLPGTPEERAYTSGLAQELVTRTPTELTFLTAPIGVGAEFGLDPLTWVGMGGGRAAKFMRANERMAMAESVVRTAEMKAAISGVDKVVATTGEVKAMKRLLSGVKGGEAAFVAGEEFGDARFLYRGKVQNIPGLAASKAERVRKAFGEEFEKIGPAVMDNIFYGTPIPEALKGNLEGWSALRRSLSELGALRLELKSIAPETLDEYPIWVKRLFDPVEESAETGVKPTPGGSRIGLPENFMREDAFIAEVSNLGKTEAEEIIQKLPPKYRPLQPSAAGASKGRIMGKDTPEWVGETFGDYGENTIKWPNTPEGQAGRDMFASRVEDSRALRDRGTKVSKKDPITRQAARSGILGAVQSDDVYRVLRDSWTDVLRRRANEGIFNSIVTGVDDAGKPLTQFISNKQLKENVTVPGYVELPEKMVRGRRTNKWGVLTRAKQGEEEGVYLVQEGLAKYLEESVAQAGSVAQALHGFLDTWAMNTVNAPRTGLMNALYNVVKVDSINGVSYLTPTGREINRIARGMVREWETTGVAPRTVEKILERGGDLRPPWKGLSDVYDVEGDIFEQVSTHKNPAYEGGARFAEWITASPLAASAKPALAGAVPGAISGAVAAPKGDKMEGAILGGALGAGAGLAMRPFARGIMKNYGRSDQRSKIAAFIKHERDGLARGLNETAAADYAFSKMDKLTQNYNRLGGFSETFAARSPHLSGADRSGVAAIKKGALNRFISFWEADASTTINFLKDPDWRIKINGILTSGAMLAANYAAKNAAKAVGLLDDEAQALVESARPGSAQVPVYDTKKGEWGVVTVSMRGMGTEPLEIPQSVTQGLQMFVGPASQTAFEGVQGLVGAENPISTYGIPVRKQKPDDPTEKESAGEALLRQNLARWTHPLTLTGRVGQTLKGIDDPYRTQAGETQSPGTVLASALIGSTRDVDVEFIRDREMAAWNAQRNDIEKEAYGLKESARIKADPSSEARQVIDRKAAERVADLAETYLKRGLREEDLWKQKGRPSKFQAMRNALVRKILIERGVIKAPKPAIPGMGG